MAKRASAKATTDWQAFGARAIDEGDLETAHQCFVEAVRQTPNSALAHLQLALVSEGLGEFAQAAQHYTEALRVDPNLVDAARRLSNLITRGALPADVKLNPWGLKAALDHDFASRDQIAEATVYFLARSGPLHDALAAGRSQGWLAAARELCVRSTGALLRDELFQKALRDSVIRQPELEHLLTALRRVLLLEVPASRFEDRTLAAFLVTLAQQCWVNEFVWPVSAEEEARLGTGADVDIEALIAGEPAAGIALARAALYRPVAELLPQQTPTARIKPQIVRDFARLHLEEAQDEAQRAAAMRRLGTISDPVSVRVADQYARYPYPRWKSLGHTLRIGEWRKSMSRHFPDDRLSFMDEPFEVLIAGCGTGRQAIGAAHAYGPNAKITAIDLSVPSLAYAERMAEYYCASGIAFAQLDINDAGKLAELSGRFDVIECMGVLHHMADPLAAWSGLARCLSPHGVMLVAVYSELARQHLEPLRAHRDYPGPGCSDDSLRRFRAQLMQELGPASDLSGIRDVYTLSGFRDLLLHVEEHRLTIPALRDFFATGDLAFRGFFGTPWQRFAGRFPDDPWPGTLESWDAFEQENPRTFTGMYHLWCERR